MKEEMHATPRMYTHAVSVWMALRTQDSISYFFTQPSFNIVAGLNNKAEFQLGEWKIADLPFVYGTFEYSGSLYTAGTLVMV